MLIARPRELRLAAVTAILLATVVGSAGATLASAAATTGPVAAQATAASGLLFAVDVVGPTPIPLSFARPVPPHAARPLVAPPAQPAGAFAGLPAPAAPATGSMTGPTCAGPGWQQRRGGAALAGLLHPRPAGVTMVFLPGGGSLRGMTYYDTHLVDIYIGTCEAESDALVRHVVAHELGHAWDSLHMTEALRARYLTARGIPAETPWFGCDRCQDFATPAGDFAETYAQWQRGAADSRSTMAPAASAGQLVDLAASFFR